MSDIKDVLTTGDVARICHVAPRTVTKWFDSGALKGYRIPGSKDRRIPLSELIRFMKAAGMPTNGLIVGKKRVLYISGDADYLDVLAGVFASQGREYALEGSCGGFAAGMLAASFEPLVIVIDADVANDIDPVVETVRKTPRLSLTKVVAVVKNGCAEMAARADAILVKGYQLRELFRTIETVLASA